MKRYVIVVKGVGKTKNQVLEEMKKTDLQVDDIAGMYIADTTTRQSF